MLCLYFRRQASPFGCWLVVNYCHRNTFAPRRLINTKTWRTAKQWNAISVFQVKFTWNSHAKQGMNLMSQRKNWNNISWVCRYLWTFKLFMVQFFSGQMKIRTARNSKAFDSKTTLHQRKHLSWFEALSLVYFIRFVHYIPIELRPQLL